MDSEHSNIVSFFVFTNHEIDFLGFRKFKMWGIGVMNYGSNKMVSFIFWSLNLDILKVCK